MQAGANTIAPEPYDVLGSRVTPFTSYDHAVACVSERIRDHRPATCVALNPEKVYRAFHDPELRGMLNRFDFGICDGVGVSAALRLLHGQRLARCTGVDLFHALLAASAERGWGVFLLGATEETNRAAAALLPTLFSGLRLAGRLHGYFRDPSEPIARITSCSPDLLFVAMGSPRQEEWILAHRAELGVPFCMGVGGTLDVVSGRVRRAPKIFRKTGTEFLYRLLCEPRRIKRQVVLPLFAMRVMGRAISRGFASS